MLTCHRLVSMQEAGKMVDNQELVICSDSITYVSLSQGQALQDETDKQQKRDLITIYRNRQRHHNHYSLDRTPPPLVHRHHQIAASGRDP